MQVVTEKSWGAFVTDFVNDKSSLTSLDKYLTLMEIKSAANTVLKGRESYLNCLDRHFDRLNKFLDNGKERVK